MLRGLADVSALSLFAGVGVYEVNVSLYPNEDSFDHGYCVMRILIYWLSQH